MHAMHAIQSIQPHPNYGLRFGSIHKRVSIQQPLRVHLTLVRKDSLVTDQHPHAHAAVLSHTELTPTLSLSLKMSRTQKLQQAVAGWCWC